MADENSKPTGGRSSKPAREIPVSVPRWAQAVLIPLGIVLVFYVGRSVTHALFVFLMAALVALFLNPLVAGMNRLKLPRALGVSLSTFRSLPRWWWGSSWQCRLWSGQLRRLVGQHAPDRGGLEPDAMGPAAVARLAQHRRGHQGEVDSVTASLQQGWTSLAGALFNFSLGVVGGLVTFVVIIFTSFYMLIDGRRIHRFLVRLVPAEHGAAERYLRGLQTSFSRFVRGQAVLGLAVGMACGLGVWILGWQAVNVWPEGSQYALLFGVWAGITEVVPYIGPWVGAIPPVFLAFFHSPGAALWVALVYLVVQQLEGHILVPNIMGFERGRAPASGDLRRSLPGPR